MSLFVVFFLSWGFANELSFQENFQKGVEAHLKNQWSEAEEAFKEALQQNPESSSTLVNLGLTYVSLQKPGLAAGHFRRALFLNPGSREARDSLNLMSQKNLLRGVESDPSLLEVLRKVGLLRKV